MVSPKQPAAKKDAHTALQQQAEKLLRLKHELAMVRERFNLLPIKEKFKSLESLEKAVAGFSDADKQLLEQILQEKRDELECYVPLSQFRVQPVPHPAFVSSVLTPGTPARSTLQSTPLASPPLSSPLRPSKAPALPLAAVDFRNVHYMVR